MKAISATPLLHRLARLYGLQTAYYDADRCRKPARAESLLAILRSLGAPIENVPDVPQAWHEKRRALWKNKLEPVVVAWDNEPSGVRIKLPAGTTEGTLNCHIRLESGEERQWQCPVSELDIIEAAEIEGTRYMDRQFPLPGRLPWGYHRLTVELAGECVETLLISAPARAYSPPGEIKNRSWGVFLPLHALHTSRSWGSGDFSDLATLAEWVAKAGGGAVATLPVLPTFQNKTFEISPYLPISRLAYHEFYLDVSRVPELGECPPA
ncbi:MAG: 4-alpha-glucanotransferase, partial [Dehalococcoidales bacterium]